MLKDSQEWLGLDDSLAERLRQRLFRDALSVSLEIMGAPSLVPLDANAALEDGDRAQWIVPQRDSQTTDPAWAATLDSLRAVRKAAEMKQLLIEQRDSILLKEKQNIYQLSLFNADELRQIEADRRHWRVRIAQLESEIDTEPQRIEEIYQVKADRIEPVGLVYLWPVSK